MNTWLDKYESEPQPMWIEEFQDDDSTYTKHNFIAEYLTSENNGCDGKVHYFTVKATDDKLKEYSEQFAKMFHYDGRGPGYLYCMRHSLAVFDKWSGVLRINEDYDN